MSRHQIALTRFNAAKAHQGVDAAIRKGGWVLELREAKRSDDQNRLLHAMLYDISRQVEWAGSYRDTEAWKDIFTAALRSAKHSLDVVPGINGGFVLLGMHTSQMTKAEFSELVELVHAFAAERGVVFRDQQEAA